MNKVKNSFEISEAVGSLVDPTVSESYRGIHLFVMAHGFQGCSFDVRMMKNIISVALPEAQFLCSITNEDSTDGNIHDMGYRLAQEVHQFVRESCPGN